jgi:hypothetical protein
VIRAEDYAPRVNVRRFPKSFWGVKIRARPRVEPHLRTINAFLGTLGIADERQPTSKVRDDKVKARCDVSDKVEQLQNLCWSSGVATGKVRTVRVTRVHEEGYAVGSARLDEWAHRGTV